MENMAMVTNVESVDDRDSDWLRARGIAAYPGTNLGGQTDYPAMAEAAGPIS